MTNETSEDPIYNTFRRNNRRNNFGIPIRNDKGHAFERYYVSVQVIALGINGIPNKEVLLGKPKIAIQ
jgi:hypothetical protein